MVTVGVMKRMVLLTVGFGAAIWITGILLGVNQVAYAQYNSKEAYLQLRPTEGKKEIGFPFEIPGTSLVAEALVHYDGPFLEDRSETELFNSVALLVRNNSHQGIAHAEITVKGNENWTFEAQYIPPMGTVLVLESSGAQFNESQITECSGWETVWCEGWQIDSLLQIDSVDMGTIAVTNITEANLTNIRLLYKNWLPDSEIFVGGITYEVQICQLLPGETVLVQPDHYARGYSKFINVYAD